MPACVIILFIFTNQVLGERQPQRQAAGAFGRQQDHSMTEPVMLNGLYQLLLYPSLSYDI